MKRIRCVIIDKSVANDQVDKLIFNAMSKVDFKNYTFFIGTASVNTSTAPRFGIFQNQSLTQSLMQDMRIKDALEAFEDKKVDIVWCISAGDRGDLSDFLRAIQPKLVELKSTKKIIMGGAISLMPLNDILKLENNNLRLLPGIESDTLWVDIHHKILDSVPEISKERVRKAKADLEKILEELKKQEKYLIAEKIRLETEIEALNNDITRFRGDAAKIKLLESKKSDLIKRLTEIIKELEEIAKKKRKTDRKIKLEQSPLENIVNMPPELKKAMEKLMNDSTDKVEIDISSSSSLTKEEISNIIRIITLCPDKLTRLTINDRIIPRNIAEDLSELLKQPDLELVKLNLSHCELNDDTIQPLLESLANYPGKLSELSLHHNKLSARSGHLLGQFVANSKSIQSLSLQDNQLSDGGVTALSQGLSRYHLDSTRTLSYYQQIYYIDLKANNITATGLREIVKALTSNPNLSRLKSSMLSNKDEALQIENNPLGDISIEILRPILLQVSKINLDSCLLTDTAMTTLCQILLQRSDTTGVALYLHGNHFSNKAILAIVNVYQQQPYRLNVLSLQESLSDFTAILSFLPIYVSTAATHDVSFETKDLILKPSSIEVKSNILGEAGVIALCESLLRCTDKRGIDLHLHSNPIGVSAFLILENLYKQQPYRLRYLSLKYSVVNAKLLLNLFPHYMVAALSDGVTLDLTGCNLTPEVLKEMLPMIAKIPNQTRLSFKSNLSLGDTGLTVICDFLEHNNDFARQLTHIDLGRCNLTSLNHLILLIQARKLINLQTILLWDNKLTDIEIKKLIDIFSLLKSTWYINISWNPFSLDILRLLIKILLPLRKENKYSKVDVSNHHLNAKDAILLVSEFPNIPIDTIISSYDDREFFKQLRLELQKSNFAVTGNGDLILEKRQLSDADIPRLITALNKQTHTIVRLNICENNLSSNGVNHLINEYFLKDETRIVALKVLDLSKNPLTDGVNTVILKLLMHPKCHLETLSLEFTGITDITLKPLVSYLKNIKNINIAGNSLSKELFESFKKPSPPHFPSSAAMYRLPSMVVQELPGTKYAPGGSKA